MYSFKKSDNFNVKITPIQWCEHFTKYTQIQYILINLTINSEDN